MEEKYIYLPFRHYKVALVISLILFIVLFASGSIILIYSIDIALAVFAVSMVFFWLYLKTVDNYRRAIFIDDNAVRSVGGNYKNYHVIKCKDIQYVYKIKAKKGNITYLVIAQQEMDLAHIEPYLPKKFSRLYHKDMIMVPYHKSEQLNEAIDLICKLGFKITEL